jgi:hypothetical protein
LVCNVSGLLNWNSVNLHPSFQSVRGTEQRSKAVRAYRNIRYTNTLLSYCYRKVPILFGVTNRQTNRWTGFTWSSAVPPMTSSAVGEHRLCPSLRSVLSTCNNRGYDRIGVVTTIYQVHKFLSVWLSSVRFCVPEETNQQRPGMEGATDSFIGQYGALSCRADMPEGAWSHSQWTTSCVCSSWVRSSTVQINGGNTIQPCRRNDEQGKWEPNATCWNVHRAKHVQLQGSGPSTEKGIVCSPQVKIPLEKSASRWENNIKMDLTGVGCKCVDWIHVVQDRD